MEDGRSKPDAGSAQAGPDGDREVRLYRCYTLSHRLTTQGRRIKCEDEMGRVPICTCLPDAVYSRSGTTIPLDPLFRFCPRNQPKLGG